MREKLFVIVYKIFGQDIVKAIIISKKTASQMEQNEKYLILLNLKNFQTFIIEDKKGFFIKKLFFHLYFDVYCSYFRL